MSIVAVIPVANMLAANATLQTAGFGPGNFSVAAYTGSNVTFAALHAWDNPAFEAAVAALPGVIVNTAGGGADAVNTLIQAQGARWGDQAPALPTSGNAVAGTLYRYTDGTLWSCIQTFSRTTFGAPPATYPALIRQSRIPGTVAPWVQPIDQFDAYKLVNPFTGLPDRATHNGSRWFVSQADGGGNNIWAPGAFGWTVQP